MLISWRVVPPGLFQGGAFLAFAPWAGQANAKKDFWRLRRFLRNRQVQIWMAGYHWMGDWWIWWGWGPCFVRGFGGACFVLKQFKPHPFVVFFWSWTKQKKLRVSEPTWGSIVFFLRHQHYIHEPMRIWWCHVSLKKKLVFIFWYSTKIAFARQLWKLECGNFHLKRVASLHGKSSANIIHLMFWAGHIPKT